MMKCMIYDYMHLFNFCAFQGHHEFPPYNPDTLRSVYHIRNVEVFKLKQVNVLIFLLKRTHSCLGEN